MAANLLSNNISSSSGSTTGNRTVDAADQVSTQLRNQQMRALMGPVAILWDIENCPVPAEVRAEDVAGNIRVALRLHPVIKGAVTFFSAYGDFNNFPRKLREGCQRTGVNLIDVPSGKKDAADKAILVDMFLFALDNPPPSTILLISGDVDFAPALHKLGQRGYTVVLAIPSGVGVSSALCNAGRFVWDWPSVARGEGLVPAKSFLSRSPELACYPLGCFSSEDSDVPNDEEAIVYKGMPQNGYIVGTSSTQTYTFNSTHIAADLSRIQLAGPSAQPSAAISRGFSSFPMPSSSFAQNIIPIARTSSTPINVSKSLPVSLFTDAGRSGTPSDTSPAPNSTPWVQPGDIQGLKGQLLKLVNTFEGSLLLGRVPAEYHKVFGRPLYLAEYGSCKLVNLIKKMSDTFCIEGKGHRKFLCLKESATDSGAINPCNTSSSDVVSRESQAMKTEMSKKVQETYSDSDACNNLLLEDAEEYCVEANAVSYSDEGSVDESACDALEGDRHEDDLLQVDMNAEKYAAEARLEVFKRELEELLVSHACKILLSSFSTLYQQRYAKELDCSIFGVQDLQALIEKVRDVAVIEEEHDGTERKFLIANCRR